MTDVSRAARRTRSLQLGFLILLTVCCAQVAYWAIDEFRYTAGVETRIRAAYEVEAEAARVLLRAGTPWRDLVTRYPNLALAADSATVMVAPGAVTALRAARFRRLNRYTWEGAFFLVVLLGAMGVVYRAVREEAELRRRQNDFLAAVSHELKSPLASLLLSTETLALRDPPPGRRGELVRRQLADIDRLQRMISNVLATSRLSVPDTHAVREGIAVADEVTAAVAEIRAPAVEAAIRLEVDVPGDLVIFADPEGVRTAVRNVLYNALRATGPGGAIAIGARRQDGVVRLMVRDDGIGFPPAEARRLFEKFYRLDGEGRGRPTGTGLGLYLVERYLALDGGTATAESAGPGLGATFTLAWPVPGEAAK